METTAIYHFIKGLSRLFLKTSYILKAYLNRKDKVHRKKMHYFKASVRKRIAYDCVWRKAYHSFHSVGQKKDDSIVTDPLGLPRTDELVNDALGGIVKIAKLSFPAHKRIGT